MKKAIYNLRGNQVVSTGYGRFDKETNCISTGNIIANTQYGNYIRPWTETECNGLSNPKGHLTEYDLNLFMNVGKNILDIVNNPNNTKDYILYEFFVEGKIIGHILVDGATEYLICSETTFVNNFSIQEKYENVIKEMVEYVTYSNTSIVSPEIRCALLKDNGEFRTAVIANGLTYELLHHVHGKTGGREEVKDKIVRIIKDKKTIDVVRI